MKLKYLGSKPVKGNVFSFLFEPEEALSWRPGQYMHYVLPHADADELENPLVYLSGPEPMVKSFAAALEVLGLGKENIKLDDFPGYEGI